jgi:hypothetical protein
VLPPSGVPYLRLTNGDVVAMIYPLPANREVAFADFGTGLEPVTNDALDWLYGAFPFTNPPVSLPAISFGVG